MQENTESNWCVGMFSDAYKGEFGYRPSQRECDHFLSMSVEEQDREMASYGYELLSVEEMEKEMAHGELWSACNLVRDKIENNLDLLSDELFEAILRAKARKEEAEQAWLDTRL